MNSYVQNSKYTYIETRYVDGKTLLSVIQDGGGLNELQIQRYLLLLVKTLLTMKDQCKIAHHDISPDNIVVGVGDSVTIIDLGLCVQTEKSGLVTNISVPHLYAGKPSHIAPELVRMDPVCDVYAADVWSLGVCVFNMLTGTALYEDPQDETFTALECRGGISQIVNRFEWTWKKSYSREVKALLCATLHPNPRKRITLEKLLAHPFIVTPKLTFSTSTWSKLESCVEDFLNFVTPM